MKNKSPKLVQFIEDLHRFITARSDLFNRTNINSKIDVKDAIGLLVDKYLEEYFLKAGYKDVISKAHDALYWEGKEPEDDNDQSPIFGERSYPDFVVNDPYLVAILYNPIINASMLKEGIGESLIYTLSGEFSFVYCLFHDQTDDKKIERSVDYKLESSIIDEMWDRYNVCMKFV